MMSPSLGTYKIFYKVLRWDSQLTVELFLDDPRINSMVYFGRISCGESRFGDRHSQVRWRCVFGAMINKHMGVASHLSSRWYRKISWSCWFDHHDSTHVFSGGFLGTATFSGFGALVELGWVYIPLRQAWGQMLEVYESCRILSKHLYSMLFLQNDSPHVLQWFHGM